MAHFEDTHFFVLNLLERKPRGGLSRGSGVVDEWALISPLPQEMGGPKQ